MNDLVLRVDEYVAGVETLDETRVRALWSAKQPVSFIHPRGRSGSVDEIWAEFYTHTMGRFSTRTLVPGPISVHRIGEAAWVEFTWAFDAVLAVDGSPLHTEGRETQVFALEDGEWRLVHVHYSGRPVTGDREGF